jgi:hypothetical protein
MNEFMHPCMQRSMSPKDYAKKKGLYDIFKEAKKKKKKTEVGFPFGCIV